MFSPDVNNVFFSFTQNPEEKLAFLEKLYNFFPDIVYVFDPLTRKIAYQNRGFELILGYSVTDIKQMDDEPLSRIMHTDDWSNYLRSTLTQYNLLDDATPLKCSFRLKNKTNQWHWFECTEYVFSRQADGTPQQMFAVLHNISDCKPSPVDSKDERESFYTILQAIDDGVILTDATGNVLAINEAAQKITGWTMQDVYQQSSSSVFSIVDELTHEQRINPISSVLENGKPIELSSQILLVSRSGTEHQIAVTATPMKDKNGSVTGCVAVFRNVTEKNRLLEASMNIRKLDALGVLAGGIAHDFNNLLGGIYGFIDLALICSSQKERSTYLHKAIATIDRTRSLTRQLLTFAKGGSPVKRSTSLFPYLSDSIAFTLSKSNATTHFSISPSLWLCNIDIEQIDQAITNIIINAEQAMPSGGEIDITAKNISFEKKEHPFLESGNYVKLSIHDHGNGIPEKIQSRIFDPFFTTKSKGHGLGLSSCYSIIKRHGGYIDVDSPPKEGATFHIFLPAVIVAEKSVLSQTKSAKKGATVLVMDDEEIIREITTDMLESLGYSVVTAVDESDALAGFKKHVSTDSLAAIILDLTVKGKTEGITVAAAIREIDQNIPIFVASGYANDPVIANPIEYGFTASIIKPFRIEELSRIIDKYVV